MTRSRSNSVPALTAGKRRLFVVAMFALPILFFLCLEGGLRLVGYGNSYPLFTPVPGFEDYLYQNREVAHRYFSHQARVPTSVGDAFRAKKDSTVFRIFVQGGSSAAGYPFYYGGTASRMLAQRLQQTFPGRNIEVVNTSLAAVNSYTLLDFADEIIAQQPDAVLIYAGHNEFYGALGVGSAESLGQFRFMVKGYLSLRHLRVVQGLRAVLTKAAEWTGGAAAGERPGATLMERMVGQQAIPLDSPLYRRGIAQFRGNLRDLLGKYRAHDIPVFVGTLASNIRSQKPFISHPPADPTARDAALVGAAHDARAGHLADALSRLDTLIRSDTLSAVAYYAKARLLDGVARFAEARDDYRRAKDRDELRFRATEEVNDVIREEAARAGAIVVPTHEALMAAAKDGLIGSDLMVDHLHPNVSGYFAIADAFYGSLRQAGLIGEWRRGVPTEVARQEILMTELDSLTADLRIQKLKGSWPFQPPGVFDRTTDTLRAHSPAEQLALDLFHRKENWLDATTKLRDGYEARGENLRALRAGMAIIQQYPFLPQPYASTANVLIKQRRYDEALAYLQAANDRQEMPMVHIMMGSIYLARKNVTQALPHLERARKLSPDNPQVLYRLGTAYAMANRIDEARKALDEILGSSPEYVPARRLLDQLNAN